MKILLILIALSSVLGGAFWQQDDEELLHFQSCDHRLEFDYPADFALQENPTFLTQPIGALHYYVSDISLHYVPGGESVEHLEPPADLHMLLDNEVQYFDDGDILDWIQTTLEWSNRVDIQEMELYGYPGAVGYSSSGDGFSMLLDMGDAFILSFEAAADNNVSLDVLRDVADTIVGTLKFEAETAESSDQYFFFTTNCELSLFYPNTWRGSFYRSRYLFYDTEDTYYNYVSREAIGEENVLVEIMSHDEILSYFELAEDEATARTVLMDFMTVRDLLPFETPDLIDGIPGRSILMTRHARGLVSVLEIDDELTIIALYTGGDVEDYVERYWALVDSVQLHGRAEEIEVKE